MLTINDLSMHYGNQLLFDEVSLNLLPGNRYAIVGANGTGKSTFLKILAGTEHPTLGDIGIPKNARVGWLRQDQYLHENDTVLDVVLQGKPQLWQALQEKEELVTKPDWHEKDGYRLADLEAVIADHDGYTAEQTASSLLLGLGIALKAQSGPLSALSGGYKLRVLLARALFENPDILLLDEPTNHLDIMTIAWLEGYLQKTFQGVLVFVSHDLDFLNNLSTHTLDIDFGEITEYVGNYQQMQQQKALFLEQKENERKFLEGRIAHLQSYVERFRAKASKARQAQSRVKMIEKIEMPEIKDSSRQAPHFKFTPQRASGKSVLSIKAVNKTFGDKQVLNNIHLDINRGEKVAIIGHNGIGKSTLLKIALGELQADHGECTWGYETHIAYFDQDHHKTLPSNQSLFDWLHNEAENTPTTTVRQVLGQVLFSKDEVNKQISALSGGECARLLFANLMLQHPNVLVLDEPTNHMDLEAIEALHQALKAYSGTLIAVSHNRHFVAEFATRIIALTEQGIKDYKGSYTEYLAYYGDDFLNQEWLKSNQD